VAVFRRQLIPVLILAVFCGALAEPVSRAATESSTHKTRSSKKKKTKAPAKKRRRTSPRLRRLHRAFVASTRLKPMAEQLLQNRTPAAYAGVEAYARHHAKQDAGALAWLVLGYAHVLDHDYAKAVDSLARAKPHAEDIGDYVDYYLGFSYVQVGRNADAIALLSKFDSNYPDSLLSREAHIQYAAALLANGEAKEAVNLLEKERNPIRSDVELMLGRGYEAIGQPEKAASILRNIYFTMPLSDEATQADAELKKLANTTKLAPPSLSDRKTRADLLLRGRQYTDAANEYRDLLKDARPAEQPAIQLALGESLRFANQDNDAKRVLESISNPTPEIDAERLYNLCEIARDADDEDGFLRILDQLRKGMPTSPWLERALLSAGNMYLLKPDYDHAIDYYRELEERFPHGSRASYAHWKVAWLSFRQGRTEQAKTGFEKEIELYPSSPEVPAALYWRGRLAEEDGNPALARAYYLKISDRYHSYYYGVIARQRLAHLHVKSGADPAHYTLLDHIPPIHTNVDITADPAPTDDLRVQKAQLLENGALLDFAVRELQAAAKDNPGNWLSAESARMYEDAERYDMAITVMKRAVPSYFALDLSSLPRSYWEALFPKAYWKDLKKFSASNKLDPFLVASLIRQESAFNPNALSVKNAVGLMQLLPKTGKLMARQVRLRYFSPNQLYTPEVNLKLGTRYFRSMIDKFGGLEYALAAYNAGDNRVQDWQGLGKYRDVQEFVESIPFTETREYVQAILRNEYVYHQLYGAP
jgi:soluble lytic murein transglycosylase